MDTRIHAELVRIAGTLPDPIWIALTDDNGLSFGFYAARESVVDANRAASLTIACQRWVEHACVHLDAGKFRYVFVGGSQGIYIFAVNNVLLSFQLTSFVSVDSILALINEHKLFSLLERLNPDGELKDTGEAE